MNSIRMKEKKLLLQVLVVSLRVGIIFTSGLHDIL